MYQKKRCIISLSEVVKFLTKWADELETRKSQQYQLRTSSFFWEKGVKIMAERITGHTELIGLMAYPIRHSSSPQCTMRH